jgi:ABC-type nitrate/sulfonate/bicarbonate transport system substrate-binding protein
MRRDPVKKNLSIILVVVAILSLGLTACSQATPEVQVKEVVVTQEVEKIVEVEKEVEVVVTPTPPPAETTVWFGAGSTLLDPYLVPIFTIGRQRLADKGIDLQYVTLSTDEAVEAALDRGRVDIGLLASVGLHRAVSQGLSMKFAVGVEMYNPFVLTVRGDVTDLEQLRDKTVGVQSRTSLSVAVAEVMLREEAGMEPGVDYEMVYLPGSDNRAAAMEAGSMDASVLFGPVAADLEARTNGEFKVFGGLWDVLDPMLWEGIAFSEDFRTNNPEVAATFVETILETYAEFYEGDSAQMATLKEGIPEAEPIEETALVGEYNLYKEIGLYPLDGGLDQEYFDRMADFLVEIGQLEPDQVVPYEEAVDPSFLGQ